jgi:hypothetical protein
MSAEEIVPLKIGGRQVAVLRGTVLDVRRTTAGLLTTPPGVAHACDLLNEAEARGCAEILVTVSGASKYRISFADFMAHSWPIQRGGYEPQRACMLSAFNVDYKTKPGGPKSMKMLDKMRKPKQPRQAMFRGW